MGAEDAGATLDDRGAPSPDDQMRIADGLFVAGDVAGGLQFTHVADYEGGIAARAAAGRPDKADLRVVPKVTFTDPEAAAVGLTVEEAQAEGIDAFEIRGTSRAPARGRPSKARAGT